MSGFGSDLRQRREAAGVSLDEICEATRVSTRYLNALEAEDYRALPGGVFNRGIVKSYARALGLDEQETVERFNQECQTHGLVDPNDSSWGEFATNVKNQRSMKGGRDLRWLGVAVMVLAVLSLAVAAFLYLKHHLTQ